MLAQLPDLAPDRLWLRPEGFLPRAAAQAAIATGEALTLAGGALGFTRLEILARAGESVLTASGTIAAVNAWAQQRGPATAARIGDQIARLTAARAPVAGLTLTRPHLMGIVNITPDSFSNDGRMDAENAIAHGLALHAAGADIIDVGGESTRPGAPSVAAEEELRRIEPIVHGLASRGILVSIDTRRATVMTAALAAGARIINDVSALADPESAATASMADGLVLMHMQGEPRTMQDNPCYELASLDIVEFLEARIAGATQAGIPRERIVVDPGVGFGKRLAHTLEIFSRLSLLHALGCGILLGASRKFFISRLSEAPEPAARVPGSIATVLYGLSQGVQLFRVHDVAEARQAVAVWQSLVNGAPS